MSVARGLLVFVGTAEEVTYGTSLAADKWNEIISESLQLTREPIVKESMRRVSQSTTFQGIKTVGGDISFELMYDGMLRWLKHLTGGGTTSGAGPEFIHTFLPVDALPVGLTVEVAREIQGYRYHGCKVNQATFSLEKNGLFKMNVSLIAEDEEKFSVGVATFPTERVIPFHEGVFSVAAAATEIDSIEFTINNNLDGERQKVGSAETKEPARNGLREVTGSFVKTFETGDVVALYDKYAGMTDTALNLIMTGAALGGSNFMYEFDFFRVVFGGATHVTEGPGIVSVTYPWRALFDEVGAQDAYRIRVTNSEATI